MDLPSISEGELDLPIAAHLRSDSSDLPSVLGRVPSAANDSDLPLVFDGPPASDDAYLPGVLGGASLEPIGAAALPPSTGPAARETTTGDSLQLPAVREPRDSLDDLDLPAFAGAPTDEQAAGSLDIADWGEDPFADLGAELGLVNGTSADPASFDAGEQELGSVSQPAGEFDGLPDFDEDFGEIDALSEGPAEGSLGGASASVQSMTAPSDAGNDPFSDGMFDLPPAGTSQYPQPSSSDNGANYGQVELAAGEVADIDTDDAMEFGEIPEADETEGNKEAGLALNHTAKPSQAAPIPSPGQELAETPAISREAQTEQDPRSGKTRVIVIAAAVGMAVVGGGALALMPDVGPFGAYYLMDALNADKHHAQYVTTLAAVEAARSDDEFALGVRSLRLAEAQRTASPRYKPYVALSAYAHYSMVLRFGGQSEETSAANVMLNDLIAREMPTSEWSFRLAQAAQKAVDGKWEAAAAQARELLQEQPSSISALCLLGEVQLRGGTPAQATLTWKKLVSLQRNPRTTFGLARALYGSGKVAEAKVTLEGSLGRSQKHVGARLLLAELLWSEEKEQSAVALVSGVVEDAASLGQADHVLARTVLGEFHLKRGRLSKAQSSFEAALGLDPKSSRALEGLGATLLDAGRYTAALARYENAATSDPTNVNAEIGVVHSFLAAGRLKDAKRRVSTLTKTHPKHAGVRYWFGRVAHAAGETDVARSAYSQSIEDDGKGEVAVDAYVSLSELLGQAGETDAAMSLLKKAQKALPASAALSKALGEVALSAGRYADALREFDRAAELAPSDVGALFKRGTSLRRLGRYEEAWKVFEAVGQVDPQLPGLALERGLLLEQSGKSAEALKEYEAALAKAPKDTDLMQRVGCGLVIAGDGKAAETVLRKVLVVKSSSAEANHCLGRALFIQGKGLEALKHLQNAVSLDTHRAQYHLHVGWVANSAGQVALAEQALNAALEIDRGLADAYWQKGVLFAKQGAMVDAVKALETALELRPSRFEARADLAQALYQLGREQLALNQWQQAISDGQTFGYENAKWHFRFGKLLNARRRNRESVEELKKSIALANAMEPKPQWLWQAHHLTALGIGPRPAALAHWRAFLELGPEDSPYRSDAERALRRAGQTWQN